VDCKQANGKNNQDCDYDSRVGIHESDVVIVQEKKKHMWEIKIGWDMVITHVIGHDVQ